MNTSVETINVWSSVLQSVEKRLNRQIFDAWFRPIQFDGFDEQEKVLRLRASQVNKDWVNTYYSDIIKQTLNELDFANYRLDWKIEETKMPEENFTEDEADFSLERQNGSSNPNDFKFLNNSKPDVSRKSSTTNFVDIEPIENSLNPKYTFQTFVVGSCNQFAHAASLAVAEAPGKTYNPMYI